MLPINQHDFRPSNFKLLSIAFLLCTFILLSALVSVSTAITALDEFVYQWVSTFRNPALNAALTSITMIGDGRLLTAPAVVLIVGLLCYQQWFLALLTTCTFVLNAMAVSVLKLSFLRFRPSELYSGADAYSFPSGHATLAVVVIGIATLLFVGHSKASSKRVAIMCALCLCALIGFSRIYVQAHWLSDVLAGFALGGLIVTLYSLIRVERFNYPRHVLAMACIASYAIASAIYISVGLSDALHYYGFTIVATPL